MPCRAAVPDVCGGRAEHLHHRKFRSRGGTDDPENLMPVCLRCHHWIHHNVRAATELGFAVPSWEEVTPLREAS